MHVRGNISVEDLAWSKARGLEFGVACWKVRCAVVRVCSILWCWDLGQRSPVISFRCSPVSYTHLDVYKRQM